MDLPLALHPMTRRRRRWTKALCRAALGAAVCVSLGTSPAAAQAAAARDVRVHATPASGSPTIGRIVAGTALTVVRRDSLANGYLHVRTPRVTGWVWGRFVVRGAAVDSVERGLPRTDSSGSAPPPNSSNRRNRAGALRRPGSPTWEVQPAWPAPDPQTSTVSTSVGACPAGGLAHGGAEARDTFTNARKNRVDVPREVHPVSFAGMVGLWSPAEHHRFFPSFSAARRDSLRSFAGRGVRVEGYLADVTPEGKEQTNCGAKGPAEVDWHMYLVEHRGDSVRRSVIVEAGPRVRPAHPAWTLKGLQALLRTDRVRISGWLLFDPEHFDAVDGYVTAQGTPAKKPWRATLWEVHPVTKIEVCRTGRWTDLDGGPPGEACTP
jgi:hypothetical protein